MTEIPLFPLSSVMFPGGRMPLQIFEQRYIDLVRSSMKQDSGFGMVWIMRGSEVAQPGVGPLNLGEWGTYARIVDWDQLPNGLLGITIEGGERFRLQDSHKRDDQLNMGQVEMLPLPEPVAVSEEWESMVEVLASLEQHPHVQGLGIKPDHSDAWQVGYALAQLLPVDEALKYDMLADSDIDSFMARMDVVLNELGGVEPD